jgi:predicted  nucleic acid-binding Zn-ribbon protein
MMEEIEELKAECKEIKGEQEKLRAEFEEEKKEIEEELIALDTETRELIAQRSGYNDAVDQRMLKTYDLLRDKRAGVAISSVIGGICQGCHLEIPPQKFNELQRCNEIMSCPHCNRLIYWGEDDFFVKVLSEI